MKMSAVEWLIVVGIWVIVSAVLLLSFSFFRNYDAVPSAASANVSASGFVRGLFTVPDVPEPPPESTTPTQPTTLVITQTEYVSVPTTVYVPVWKEPRQFTDTTELAAYLESKPAILPAFDSGDCDDIARLFMLDALRDGYLVSMQYLPYWPRGGGPHMLNMVFIGNAIYYIESPTDEFWWVSVLD